MNKLYVIGAGPGSADMLTPEARSAINGSDLVWCAERNGVLVPENKRP